MKRTLCIFTLLFTGLALCAQEPLKNLSLDSWSRDGKVWVPDGWGTGNKGTITLGKNVTEPEDSFLAVKGPGKRAARLRSEFIGVLGMGKFASASLYTGHFIKVVGTSGAQLSFGQPYNASRPKSLHGYYAYTPGIIDYAGKSKEHLKGKTDHGHIEIYLTNWKEPFLIDNSCGKNLDPKAPYVIGYAVIELDRKTNGYVEFDIPIHYVSDQKPTFIGIMAASSKWGDTFTGSTQSVLYLDEFELRY